MKLRSKRDNDALTIFVSGDVDGARCNCLEHFWDRQVDVEIATIHLDFEDVEEMDPVGMSEVVALLRRALRDGIRLVVHSAPQMLAHTLYKTGLIAAETGLTLVEPRSEEPYAG